MLPCFAELATPAGTMGGAGLASVGKVRPAIMSENLPVRCRCDSCGCRFGFDAISRSASSCSHPSETHRGPLRWRKAYRGPGSVPGGRRSRICLRRNSPPSRSFFSARYRMTALQREESTARFTGWVNHPFHGTAVRRIGNPGGQEGALRAWRRSGFPWRPCCSEARLCCPHRH